MDNSRKLLKTFQLTRELPTLQHHCNNNKTCKLILGRDSSAALRVLASLRLIMRLGFKAQSHQKLRTVLSENVRSIATCSAVQLVRKFNRPDNYRGRDAEDR